MADLVEKLKEIGFNSYEAKVYIALLKKHPATGYEVAKFANIPQSRVYDTLKILETKNIISQVNSEPAMYTPVKPKTLLASYQKKMNSDICYFGNKGITVAGVIFILLNYKNFNVEFILDSEIKGINSNLFCLFKSIISSFVLEIEISNLTRKIWRY